MDEHRLLLHQALVPLLRVLPRRVEEEAGADGLLDLDVVAPRGDEVELVAVHDGHELLAHVLRAPHGPRLDEVLEAPGVGELAAFQPS